MQISPPRDRPVYYYLDAVFFDRAGNLLRAREVGGERLFDYYADAPPRALERGGASAL